MENCSKRELRYRETSNPWGLTFREVDAMDAICEHFVGKLAASVLGVSVVHHEALIGSAKRKMGTHRRLKAILEFDRWKRDREKQNIEKISSYEQ